MQGNEEERSYFHMYIGHRTGPLSSRRYVELRTETSAFSFTLTITNNPPFPGLELMD